MEDTTCIFADPLQANSSLIKIENSLFDQIKICPYFKACYNKNTKDPKKFLLSLSHNSFMSNMLGIYTPNLSDDLEGIEVFNTLKTQMWIAYYTAFINFLTDPNARELILSKKLIRFFRLDGKELIGNMTLYKNQVIVDDEVINEIYYVWEIDESYKSRYHVSGC